MGDLNTTDLKLYNKLKVAVFHVLKKQGKEIEAGCQKDVLKKRKQSEQDEVCPVT